MGLFFERSATLGTRTVDDDDAFTMLQMSYNMNACLISVTSRNTLELQRQANFSDHVTNIAETIQSAGRMKAVE
eukprot:7596400-Pyramimonas_sp.AAC.1